MSELYLSDDNTKNLEFFELCIANNKMVKSWTKANIYTVQLGNKERFDKEQISVKEQFPVTKYQFTS